MAETRKRGGIVAALSDRNYRIYCAGSTVSLVGMWIQRVAVAWLAWTLTESATWLGILALADLAPSMLFAPFAGALADRIDRLRMIWATQVAQMIQALALIGLTVADAIDIWWLLALTFVLGIATAFNAAARLAILPTLVPDSVFPSVVGMESATYNVARFIGPAISGIVIASFGLVAAFVVNACTYVAVLVAIAFLRPLREEVAHIGRRAGIWRETWDGLAYAFAHPGLRPVLFLLAASALTLRAVPELLPGFAERVFAGGAVALSMLTSAVGLGALLGAVWMAERGRLAGLGNITLTALYVGTAAFLGFVATAEMGIALGFAVVAGFAMVCLGAGVQTLMQSMVEGQMRGRVMSLYAMLHRGGPAFGAVLLGALADAIGLRLAVAIGGTVSLLAAVALTRAMRGVPAREIERQRTSR